jgi:hypothetical protein
MLEHVLTGLLPSGSDLPSKAPVLALQLADIIDTSLSVDVKQIRKIDNYIIICYNQKGYQAFEDLQTPVFFEPLFAFIGEAIIKATGGEWRMVQFEAFDVWEPWIVWKDHGQLVGYQLSRICGLFLNPDPEIFSIADDVEYVLKFPRRFSADQ